MSVRFRAVVLATAFALSTIAGVAILEVGIRVSGRLQRRGIPDYGDTIQDGLLKPDFSADVVGGEGGTVHWTNNHAGFRSTREFNRQPPPGTVRILSVGDSFTAGYRVDDEKTFSRQLELWLNQSFGPTEVLINGIEEPANGLRYLRDDGVAWSPHVVLFGITIGNDIAQSYIAGNPTLIGFTAGLEKLELPSSSLEHGFWQSLSRRLYYASIRSRLLEIIRPRRAIVSWYGHVYPPRLFDANNGFGVFLKNPPEEVEVAYQRLFAILSDVREFCETRGIRLIVAVFPQRFQVQDRDWQAALAAYGLRDEAFDLSAPNDRIRRFCEDSGIPCVDPTTFMRKTYDETGHGYYFSGGDMHWNGAGHALWAEGAKDRLSSILLPLYNHPNLR